MTLYFIPAASEAAARSVVAGIELKRIPALPEYLDAMKATENFDAYPASMQRGLRLWCIERRTVDDGRITVARVVDTAGEIAAAMVLTVGAVALTALATLI